jgi:integrase
MEVFSMASIQKRKKANGEYSYRVRIRVEGAPLITDTFPTRKAAEAFARRMEAEVRDGRYFGREEDKGKTFAKFIDRYIEKELPKNPKSFSKQKMLLSWWKSNLGDYYLCHITPAMIAELRDKLMTEMTPRKSLRTSSTANRYLAALSRAYTICQKEWHWIKENPVLKITRPKENNPRERYLEREEIELLLEACKKSKSPHLYAVTVFALGTGARKGEILGLKWEDLDFKKSIATFRNTKNGSTRTVYLLLPYYAVCKKNKESELPLANLCSQAPMVSVQEISSLPGKGSFRT